MTLYFTPNSTAGRKFMNVQDLPNPDLYQEDRYTLVKYPKVSLKEGDASSPIPEANEMSFKKVTFEFNGIPYRAWVEE